MYILDTWSLTLDIWHRYLTCYHLTPDTWHVIFDSWYLAYAITWYLTCFHMVLVHLTWCCDTWHLLSFDTWQLTCYHSLDMLSHGTSTLDLMLWHLTGLLLHLYYVFYSWLLLLRGLGMIIMLLLDIWYSWNPILLTPVLLNSCIPEPLW